MKSNRKRLAALALAGLSVSCANAQTSLEDTLSNMGLEVNSRIYFKVDNYFNGYNQANDFQEIYFNLQAKQKIDDNMSFNLGVDYRDYNHQHLGGELFSTSEDRPEFVDSNFTIRQANFEYKTKKAHVKAGMRMGKEDLVNNGAHSSNGISFKYNFTPTLSLKALYYYDIARDDEYEAYARTNYVSGRDLWGAVGKYQDKKSMVELAYYRMGESDKDQTHNGNDGKPGPINFANFADQAFENNPYGYYVNASHKFNNGLKIDGQFFAHDWDIDNHNVAMGMQDVFANTYLDATKLQTKISLRVSKMTPIGYAFAGYNINGDNGGAVSFTNGLSEYAAGDNKILNPSWKSLNADYRAGTKTFYVGLKTKPLFKTFLGTTFVGTRYIAYDNDLELIKNRGYTLNANSKIEKSEIILMTITKVRKGLALKVGYSGVKYDESTIDSSDGDTQHVFRTMLDYRF